MYTPGNLLQVRVVFDRVRREPRSWSDIGVLARWRCLHRLDGTHSLVPPSHVVHAAHRRGGPFHFVTIFGIRVARVRRMARSRGCARSVPYVIGTSACRSTPRGETASLWAPASLSRWLNGESGRRCLNSSHESTPCASRCVRVQQTPRSFLEPTASRLALHPEVTRPNPLTRVSVTLSRECQQPCHSGSAPAVSTDWSPPETCSDRREQGEWHRDNTLVTGLGRMIGACNVSNR